MTIPFNTDSQSLFPRAGVIFSRSNFLQNLLNANTTAGVSQIAAGYASDQTNLINGLYTAESSFRSAPVSWFQYLQTLLQNTFVQMAYDDGTGINPINLLAALQKVVTQMTSGNYYITRPTTSVVVTANGGNTGNGKIIASLTDGDGLPLDYVFAETVTATVTADGYTGGTATAGSEPITAVGEVAAPSVFSYDYPLGSGGENSFDTLNPALTGLIVTNGNFANWSGGTPVLDDWNIGVGTAGSTISRNNSPYLPTADGAYNLRITGNGSELTTIRQAVSLLPNTVYAFGCWMKTDGAVAAGVIAARLVTAANATASSSTVITNDQSTDNSISQNVNSLGSSYSFVSGFFQTPAVLPTTVYLELKVTTAITNTENLDISALGLQAATQFYAGGPWLAAFRGSTNFATGDKFTIAVANNATINSFSLQLDRYLGLRELGIKIPSAGGTLIPNSLLNTFPSAPQGFSATPTGSGNVEFDLTTDLPGASSYAIYKDNVGTYQYIQFSDFPLTENVGAGTYSFSIDAVDASGDIRSDRAYLDSPTVVT